MTTATMNRNGSKARRSPGGRADPEREPAVRMALVRRIRREIEAGVYETPDRLELATERLLGSREVSGTEFRRPDRR